mmetsp:Transcript_53589/g.110551  ORF Transcript_53589/g.110551 Transcript_53589/m.110551 type:complete len:423 (+) Transcript_53589:26-1294(+)
MEGFVVPRAPSTLQTRRLGPQPRIAAVAAPVAEPSKAAVGRDRFTLGLCAVSIPLLLRRRARAQHRCAARATRAVEVAVTDRGANFTESRASEAAHHQSEVNEEPAVVDQSRLGVRNPKFVSRAERAPWGPLPYAVATEEMLAEPQVELIVVACVLLSSLLVALETLPVLCQPGWQDAANWLAGLENGICAVFMIEFALRWYSRSLRPTYILKPLVIIDILAFLPLLLRLMGITESDTMAAVIAGVRLLRVFRLQRFLQDYDGFLTLASKGLGIDPKYVTPVQLEVTRVLLSIFTLLYTATGAIYAAEHDVNPQFPDFFTALYFGLTTLTTVGFGDITPITAQGRLVVAASILAGVGIIPYQLSKLAEVFMATASFDRQGIRFQSIQESPESSGRQCPSCNATPHRKDAAFCWRCGAVMPVD